jgi:hypothetical protein
VDNSKSANERSSGSMHLILFVSILTLAAGLLFAADTAIVIEGDKTN